MFDKDVINARLKKSLQGSTPKLKCIVSGVERVTSMDYLKTKEDKFGSIDMFVKNYISQDALRLLKQNKPFNEIKNELNPGGDFVPNQALISEALKYYNV